MTRPRSAIPARKASTMTTITRFATNPFSDLFGWLDDEPLRAGRGFGLVPNVRVEDYVDEGAYVVRAEMPGIDPEKDVEVTVDGDVLTIRGERRAETKERGHQEFHYGSFARSLRLPSNAKSGEISASYDDGVLELRVPLGEDQTKARVIPVQRAQD